MANKKDVKLPRNKVKVFKIRNRTGYAAIYQNNITEGKTAAVAYERMLRAVRRKAKNK